MSLTRREFLQQAVGVSGFLPIAACAANAWSVSRSAVEALPRVVVIGAGLAGVAAARELAQSGWARVVLLEARDRLGGRIESFSGPRGEVFERGANWIHHGKKSNPLVALCQRYGLKTMLADNWTSYGIHSPRGPYSSKRVEEIEEVFENEVDRLRRMAGADGLESESVQRAFEDKILPRLSSRHRDWVVHKMRTSLEDDYGAACADLSYPLWAADDPESGGDLILPGGYSQLVGRLAADVSNPQHLEVVLSCPVHEIHVSQSGVVVSTARGAFNADRVIVSVPLGVLKARKIRFSPELPDWKTDVIERIGFGNFEKAFLTFPQPFWRNDLSWFEYQSPDPLRTATIFNVEKFMPGTGTLIGLASGATARFWSEADGEQVRARFIEALRPLGLKKNQPLFFESTRWALDTWTLGSYSFLSVRERAGDRERLRQSVHERIHFAGEATDTKSYGTAHGAYRSGLIAAGECLAKLAPA